VKITALRMGWIRIIRASLTLLVGKRLASLMLGAQLALDLGLGPGR
jgi:hypothetical protein